MLKDNTRLKLNKNLLKRFEENLDNGVLFLFNVETNDLWTGNESAFDIIKLIDGKKTLKKIYSELLPLFEGHSYEELKQSCDTVISDLRNDGFVEYV